MTERLCKSRDASRRVNLMATNWLKNHGSIKKEDILKIIYKNLE